LRRRRVRGGLGGEAVRAAERAQIERPQRFERERRGRRRHRHARRAGPRENPWIVAGLAGDEFARLDEQPLAPEDEPQRVPGFGRRGYRAGVPGRRLERNLVHRTALIDFVSI
jgi:hypothetical protein